MNGTAPGARAACLRVYGGPGPAARLRGYASATPPNRACGVYVARAGRYSGLPPLNGLLRLRLSPISFAAPRHRTVLPPDKVRASAFSPASQRPLRGTSNPSSVTSGPVWALLAGGGALGRSLGDQLNGLEPWGTETSRSRPLGALPLHGRAVQRPAAGCLSPVASPRLGFCLVAIVESGDFMT